MNSKRIKSSTSSVWSSSTSKFKSPYLGQIDIEACKALQASLSAKNVIDGGNHQQSRSFAPRVVLQAVDMFGPEIKEVLIIPIIKFWIIFYLTITSAYALGVHNPSNFTIDGAHDVHGEPIRWEKRHRGPCRWVSSESLQPQV